MEFVAASSQYCTIPPSANLQTTNLSVMAWMDLVDTGSNWQGILSASYSNGAIRNYWLGFTNSNYPVFSAAGSGGTKYAVCNTAVRGQGLHHVAVTWDNTSVIFYVDGVQKNTETSGWSFTPFTDPTTIYLGASYPAGQYADGQVYDVRLYDRALAKEEVAEIYSARGTDRLHRGCVMRHQLIGPLDQTVSAKPDFFGNHIATPVNPPVYRAVAIGRPAA